MAGRIQWEAQIDSNVARLLSDAKELRNELDGIKKNGSNIKVNINEDKIGRLISNLDKISNFDGKFNFDYKDFDELSNKINLIMKEINELKESCNDNRMSLNWLDNFTDNLDDQIMDLESKLNNLIKKINSDEKISIFNEDSLNTIINLFTKIENHLVKMKTIFVDVGDGEEFSPLLKMINNVQSSVSELNTSVKGIGLNMSIDMGSDKELEDQYQEKVSKALIAYQRLFDQIKMSGVGGSLINDAFFNFDLNQFDTTIGKVRGLKQFIDKTREDAKALYGGYDVLKNDTDSKYWNQASSALAQISIIEDKMKSSSDTSPLENLFGKTDLTEVVSQLGLILSKLEEISSTALEFKNTFADGFNVTASVEEIEKLTSRVKELEDELSKIKVPISTTPVESNISSSIKDTFQSDSESLKMEEVTTATEEAVQAKKDFATANEGVQDSVDGSKSKLELETELMERLAKSAREAADAKIEFVEANKLVQDSIDNTGKSAKKDKYKNRPKISEDEYINKSNDYASIANQKLKDSDNTILGESVSTELVDGLVKVTAKIKTADDTWKTFSSKIDADGNMFEQRFRTITKGVDKLESELKNFGLDTNPALTYGKTLEKAEEIRKELKLDDSYTIKVDSNELVTITQKLSDVESSTTTVTQTFRSATDAINNFGKKASSSAEKTTVALKGVKASAESVSETVENSFNLRDVDKKLENYNKKLTSFTVKPAEGNRYPVYQQQIDKLTSKVQEFETLKNKLSQKDIIDKDDIESVNKLQKEIDELILSMSKMSAGEKGFDPLSADKALEKINSELKKNSAMSKEAKRQIQGFYEEIRSGNPSKPIKDLLDDMYKLIQAERLAGREGRSFIDVFKEKVFFGAAANLAGMFGIYDVINIIRQASDTVIDLNTQITELAKVSEASMSQIYDDFNSYAEIAKDVGGTISDTISATSDWSKNGYSIPDSKKLAEVALIYKNVGDGIDIDEANESLISTLRGFKMEAEDAMHIIDVFNEVNLLASYYSNVIALCNNTY